MPHYNKKPSAKAGQRRFKPDDAIFTPIKEVRIGYVLSRHSATGGHFTFALYGRPVNLLHEPCTCWASGTCDVCQAWASLILRMQERRVARC